MLTCELSPPTKCVRGGPSLCRCVRDCSAFTVKIMVVSNRITPTTHIWRRLLLLLLLRPQPLPTQYRWQFDDCISCILFVVHALCFLINTIFNVFFFLLFYLFIYLCVCVCINCFAKRNSRRSCLLKLYTLDMRSLISFNDSDRRNSIWKTIAITIKRRRRRQQQPKQNGEKRIQSLSQRITALGYQ